MDSINGLMICVGVISTIILLLLLCVFSFKEFLMAVCLHSVVSKFFCSVLHFYEHLSIFSVLGKCKDLQVCSKPFLS